MCGRGGDRAHGPAVLVDPRSGRQCWVVTHRSAWSLAQTCRRGHARAHAHGHRQLHGPREPQRLAHRRAPLQACLRGQRDRPGGPSAAFRRQVLELEFPGLASGTWRLPRWQAAAGRTAPLPASARTTIDRSFAASSTSVPSRRAARPPRRMVPRGRKRPTSAPAERVLRRRLFRRRSQSASIARHGRPARRNCSISRNHVGGGAGITKSSRFRWSSAWRRSPVRFRSCAALRTGNSAAPSAIRWRVRRRATRHRRARHRSRRRSIAAHSG